MDKGIRGSGQGFDAASAGRLGSHGFIATHNPPVSRMRSIALQVRICGAQQGIGRCITLGCRDLNRRLNLHEASLGPCVMQV